MAGDNTSATVLQDCLQGLKKGMVVVFGFSIFTNLLLLAAPIYMLQVYDRVLTSRSTDTLLFLTLIIGFAIATYAVLETVRSGIVIRLGVWLDRRLGRELLADSIVRPLRSGTIANVNALADLKTCRGFLSGSELFSFLDAPWAPVFLLFVYLLHPFLGLLALTGAVLLFAMAVANERLTRAALADSGQAGTRAMQQAQSAVRNGDVIDAMGMLPSLVERWNVFNGAAVDAHARASLRGSLVTAASRFIRQMLQVAMLGTGAWLVIRGEVTPGAMIAGSILMGRALAPVEQAISGWRSAVNARTAFGRVHDALADAGEGVQAMSLPAPRGDLSVEGVTYMHPGQAAPVLKNVSFHLPAGRTLGVIGPSGAGKTTLVRLLLGNLAPRMGHVRLDGMDVSRWRADDLGRHCGYLPQDIELFSGTVAENIARMGVADPGDIVAAARLAGCHDLILRFSHGYETRTGDNGLALSGGERQRIALARALFGDPPFIVLDEPNASLDAIGEAALLDAIKTLKAAGKTLVIIGHRPSIIQHVDDLLVLNRGQVQEFGPKEQVLASLSGNARQDAATPPDTLGETS